MTKTEFYTVLQEVALLATGVPRVILANPNKEAPKTEYCAIHIDAPRRQRGQAIIRDKNFGPVSSPIGNVFDVDAGVSTQMIADVDFNFYRGDANIYASRMFQANKIPSISALLFANKIGWQGSDAVNDLTALQSNKREPRAQVRVRFMYEQSYQEVVNSIYGVATEVEDEEGNILVTDFIQAPTEP